MHAHDKKDGSKQRPPIPCLRHSPMHHHYSLPLINLPLWPMASPFSHSSPLFSTFGQSAPLTNLTIQQNCNTERSQKGGIHLKKGGIVKSRGRCVCRGMRGSQNTEGAPKIYASRLICALSIILMVRTAILRSVEHERIWRMLRATYDR